MADSLKNNSCKKILFVSGSVGLDHVTRDLAITDEIRRQNPLVDIYWLAGEPATKVLQERGENLVKEAETYSNESQSIEKATQNFRLNPLKFILNLQKSWKQNSQLFKRTTDNFSYDLVIGDEAYEISLFLGSNPQLKDFPFVMIYDFIGLDAISSNPLEKVAVFLINKAWVSKLIKRNVKKAIEDVTVFVGEPEDIPDKPFGWFLPNRRKLALSYCKFAGYVLPFEVDSLLEEGAKKAMRRKLGFGEKELLIVASMGGTAAGEKLLELCSEAFDLLKAREPNSRMIIVGGPRFQGETFAPTDRKEIKSFVPNLYEYFAACDLAIVQGGGTTTLELTALKKPFIYFPLEGHFEQEVLVEHRLKRHKAGYRMRYSEATPEKLQEKILEKLKCKDDISYVDIDTEGAKRTAQLINELL